MSLLALAGHVPSALSMVDYLTVMFEHVDPRRDRLLLGKPFGAQAYYAAFAARGWIEPSWELYGSSIPEWTYIIGREHPLVHFIDDSMGNALGVACGVAHAHRGLVYVSCSDAALQTGTLWEAVQYGAARRLGNLLVSIDNNDMQVAGPVSEICPVEPLTEKFVAFGWRVFRCDGHDIAAVDRAVRAALGRSDRPTVLVFDTTKGKGVSFMEGSREWHYRKLDAESYAAALGELM
jgi:transketolase